MLEYFKSSEEDDEFPPLLVIDDQDPDKAITYDIGFDLSNPTYIIITLKCLKYLELRLKRIIELLDAEEMLEKRMDEDYIEALEEELEEAETIEEAWTCQVDD